MSCDHLWFGDERESGMGECDEKLTIFVRALNTSMVPADVPTNTYLPEGSNRATVIADLVTFS